MTPTRVVVTPAGRERYLRLLHRHLAAQRDSFDTWVLLANTAVPSDLEYLEKLARENEWVEVRHADGSNPHEGNLNIHRLLNQFCRDPDAVYLRLDDDIVYLAPGFVETMFAYRLAHPEPFLVYGNIINNAILSHVHTKLGNLRCSRHPGYSCMDPVGWADPAIAREVHDQFLRCPVDPKWIFGTWVASEYERISINCISWFGRDLVDEGVGVDEEHWFAVHRPSQLGRPNVVCGAAVCVHFAFYTQRPALEEHGDVLLRYEALAPVTPSS